MSLPLAPSTSLTAVSAATTPSSPGLNSGTRLKCTEPTFRRLEFENDGGAARVTRGPDSAVAGGRADCWRCAGRRRLRRTDCEPGRTSPRHLHGPFFGRFHRPNGADAGPVSARQPLSVQVRPGAPGG